MSADLNNSSNQISFKGKIHQISNSHDGNFLLVHISEKDKTDSVHLFDLESLMLFKTWTANKETPNISIRSFNETRFIGISFSQIQNPDLIDVLVFEWEKQDPCYVFPNTKLLAANTNMIEIKHPMIENRTTQIDLSTGMVSAEKTIIDQQKTDHLQLPIPYDQSNTYFNWFEKIISKTGDTPVIQCEHLECNDLHLISYYTRQEKTLTNHLMVLDKNGQQKEKYTLASNLKGIGKDTFFVIKNKAIFVTNYNELNVLHL